MAQSRSPIEAEYLIALMAVAHLPSWSVGSINLVVKRDHKALSSSGTTGLRGWVNSNSCMVTMAWCQRRSSSETPPNHPRGLPTALATIYKAKDVSLTPVSNKTMYLLVSGIHSRQPRNGWTMADIPSSNLD